MGCDIHLYCEKLSNKNDDPYWWCCDHFYLLPERSYFDHELIPLYDGRNYELFAALADVRNRGTVEPISQPKGLPNDLSQRVREEAEKMEDIAHSHSWLTAKELFVYQNRHPSITYTGLLSPEQLKAFDECGIPPKSWCQGTNMEGYERREWTMPGSPIDYLVEKVKERMTEVFCVYDFYDDEKKEEMFWQKADDFRIVFWFDN